MFMYNPIGTTLAEIDKDCGCYLGGYSVFVLQDEDDITGIPLGTDISIGLILRENPEYAKSKVIYANDFFGIVVLRVLKGSVKE